jgi:hypothetical protein
MVFNKYLMLAMLLLGRAEEGELVQDLQDNHRTPGGSTQALISAH